MLATNGSVVALLVRSNFTAPRPFAGLTIFVIYGPHLTTFRRKTRFQSDWWFVGDAWDERKRRKPRGLPAGLVKKSFLGAFAYLAIARPILMRLSAMMPNPTHRFIPSSSL
jgi:hypothetical protein